MLLVHCQWGRDISLGSDAYLTTCPAPSQVRIGIQPEKPPYTVREGGSRLCFVRDPDGYRIELVEKPAA